MKLLKVEDLLNRLEKIQREMTPEEFANLKIVIGDDEELNGAHYSFYCDLIKKGDQDFEDITDYIEEDMFILIS